MNQHTTTQKDQLFGWDVAKLYYVHVQAVYGKMAVVISSSNMAHIERGG